MSLWEESAPGYKNYAEVLRVRSRAGRPTELPPVLVDMLSRMARCELMPAVLPSVELVQMNKRNVAGSVRNRATDAWWESDAGREWAAQRSRLLHEGELDPVTGPAPQGAPATPRERTARLGQRTGGRMSTRPLRPGRMLKRPLRAPALLRAKVAAVVVQTPAEPRELAEAAAVPVEVAGMQRGVAQQTPSVDARDLDAAV